MARYIDPVCRQCRRIGEKLFLKGERCYTPRCAIERHRRPPGDTSTRRRRPSDWAFQLKQKQKARFTYGVLERQFRKYFEMARDRTGVTGDNLMQLLETRLDNVVYRLSFVDSRRQGRQMVGHGHLNVNGKKGQHTLLPGSKEGDVVSWKQSNGKLPEFVTVLTDGLPKRPVPTWLSLDVGKRHGRGLGHAGHHPDRHRHRLTTDRGVLLQVAAQEQTRMVVDFQSLIQQDVPEAQEEVIPSPSITVADADDMYGTFVVEAAGVRLCDDPGQSPQGGFCTAPCRGPRSRGSR